jgi:4-hydroxybenzoate polyprenyltransferase
MRLLQLYRFQRTTKFSYAGIRVLESHASSLSFDLNKQRFTLFSTQSQKKTEQSSIQPYIHLARLDRPIGISLLYWPCAWSIQMATFSNLFNNSLMPGSLLGSVWNPDVLALFFLGAIVMRGAGCTINDMWDRNIDSKVARTRDRPLASGVISTRKAFIFLAGQLSVGLAILTQLDICSIALGSLALVPVIVYPFLKRITYWPQLMLGIAFNWGALLGMPATMAWIHGSNSSCSFIFDSLSVTLPLYVGGIFWTLVYDTIYAHQDKIDDLKVGVKSTALRFGSYTPWVLSAFALACIILWNISAASNNHSIPFHIGLTSLLTGHFYRQIWHVNYDSPSQCLLRFKSNHYLGSAFFLFLLLDTIFLYIEQNNL